MEVVAKGARRNGSRLSGCSEPLSVSILQLAKGKRSGFVTQAQPIMSFPGAFAEVASALLPHGEPAPEGFSLVVQALKHLEAHPKPTVALAWAESLLMEMAGFQPHFDACAVTAAPITEAMPFVSPSAGGYVAEEVSGQFYDRFRARAEILYGLDAVVKLEEPPGNLKFAEEALIVLNAFIRHIAEKPLPAHEAFINHLRHR
jgi:DNA repair protein RecO